MTPCRRHRSLPRDGTRRAFGLARPPLPFSFRAGTRQAPQRELHRHAAPEDRRPHRRRLLAGRRARLRLLPVRSRQRRQGLRGDLRLVRLRPGLSLFRLPHEGLPARQDLGRADAAQRMREQRLDRRSSSTPTTTSGRASPSRSIPRASRRTPSRRSGSPRRSCARTAGAPRWPSPSSRSASPRGSSRSGASISSATSTASTRPTTGPTSTATCPSSSRAASSAA